MSDPAAIFSRLLPRRLYTPKLNKFECLKLRELFVMLDELNPGWLRGVYVNMDQAEEK